jgi:imidazolonepropionase-like amidohydrolase
MTSFRIVASTLSLGLLLSHAALGQADYVFVGANVLTMDREQPTAEAVALADDRILAVGSDEAILRYAGADSRVIDLHGKTLIPGLVDAHVHLLIAPDRIVDEASLREYERTTLPAIMTDFLNHGVTTVRSTGDPLPYIAELRARMERASIGPRVVITGPVPSSPGGHPALTVCADNSFCRQTLAREIGNEEQAREAVRELARANVDAVKIIIDDIAGRFLPATPPRLSDSIVAALVDEAHSNNLPIIAHVTVMDVVPMVERLVSLGLDGFVHDPLSQARVANPAEIAPVAALLRSSDIPVTLTLTTFDVYRDAMGAERFFVGGGMPYRPVLGGVLGGALLTAKALDEAGVKLLVGTDWSQPSRAAMSDDPRLRPGALTLHEMELMRRAGISTPAILTAATANGAEAFGMIEELGTISEGKLADLVILDGDPLEDFSAIRRTVAVFKAGRLVSGSLPNR